MFESLDLVVNNHTVVNINGEIDVIFDASGVESQAFVDFKQFCVLGPYIFAYQDLVVPLDEEISEIDLGFVNISVVFDLRDKENHVIEGFPILEWFFQFIVVFAGGRRDNIEKNFQFIWTKDVFDGSLDEEVLDFPDDVLFFLIGEISY